MNPIPGRGITPEAAEAMGLDPTDPRIAIGSDETETANVVVTDEDGISGPFLPLTSMGDGGFGYVPADLSSGDSISDVGIGDGGETDSASESVSPARSRISRIHRDAGDKENREPRDPSNKPPSLDEWTNFFGKVVLKVACDWYLSFAFNGVDEDALTDREVDRLAMTDKERGLISVPLAELSNKSKFMRKHGRSIVASGDAFHAMVTLGAWMSRVNRIAAKHKQSRIRVNGVNNNGSSGQGTASPNGATYTRGTANGRVPDGYPVYRPGTG
jgi:hypothetical protein